MFKNIFNKRNVDLFLVIIITLIVSVSLIKIDAYELLTTYTQEHEDYELDELILILLVGSFCAIWYSIRRYNENKKLQIEILNINKKLNEENLKKDNLLLDQSKMAALGEMLNNIAHQWRQPLSVISTSASGLQLIKEFGPLDDKQLDRSLDMILKNTTYLSETIDNFRSFIKNEDNSTSFNLDDNINKNLSILDGSLKMAYVVPILDLNVNAMINNYPNELTQVFINLINNSKDALESNNIEKKYIFITSTLDNDEVTIKIRDNANGISNNIIDKVFEPYFTTKHQSKGTELGLYMVYKIITERMQGKISVQNVFFKYDNKEFKGAEFTIKININLE